MNAPEKIYLGIKELDTGYVYALSLDNNGEQEYIRKNTLTEWVKVKLQEAMDEQSEPFEYYENGKVVGEISAFEQIMDKLNSM